MVKQKVKHYKSPLKNALYGALTAFVLYWGITLLWWQFAPYQTADLDVPIEIVNEENVVKSGGDIRMLVVFSKNSDITPVVSRNVICQENVYDVDAPSTGGRARPQGEFIVQVKFKLSEEAKPGEICVFQFQNDYKVNPIRTIRKVWQSEPFEVI